MQTSPLKIHLFDGIPFVDSPYERAFVRRDIFASQFIIECQGLLELPEDEPVHGTWWTSATLTLGESGLIQDAVALARQCVENHDFVLDRSSDELDFRPQLIHVHDRRDRLVLAGSAAGSAIAWCVPVGSDEEAAAVATEACTVQAEGSVEYGWDNYETARSLWLRADSLRGRLVDPYWRAHARNALTSLL
ncbi:hypothetical protein [Acidomonas methanolica]|uniref:Uncharacterized protein n=1 Tax=Acidomonas methanolica NBRC 104435 TaxID=1231351 RepID=A0A023D566_ACIMT|nr:hypothetical protein [Acidomonas methanolica]MBU2654917.1 hypothetical protein [Acidomonas methanolica]TCS29461.1 hypothetical protein EDC31_10629 [Acidomonas methanolica]GAJ29303.1 hypothetical protein Amme_059_022 [Acidomonas methanolica NBRC 104435]GBQ45633.1 hypothetical protein AA0498_0102 [Acidomonas methanolica]GEK99067.1 hypothetical protein AME01nite_15660 [Acidomonas methanolica NBRC 104435]